MHPMLVHPYFRGKGVHPQMTSEITVWLKCGLTAWNGVSRVPEFFMWAPMSLDMGGPFLTDNVYTLESYCDAISAMVDAELAAQQVVFDGGKYTRNELMRLLGSAAITSSSYMYSLQVLTSGKSWIYLS